MVATQLFANALITAGVAGLVGLGFSLIYRSAGFFNFSHAIVLTWSGYFSFLFARVWEVPLVVACLAAVCCSVVLGCLTDLLVFRPLRRQGTSPLVLLLASLGLYVLLQNVISLIFGDAPQSVRSGPAEGFEFLGARVTYIQAAMILVGPVALITSSLWLNRTPLGTAVRAVASNPGLADARGIDRDRVIIWMFAVGSALAAMAGILIALDVDITPTMGIRALMMGVAAVIVGGQKGVLGIALAALLLGIALQAGSWWVGSEWQDAILYGILIAFLIFRPHGVFGTSVRSEDA